VFYKLSFFDKLTLKPSNQLFLSAI